MRWPLPSGILLTVFSLGSAVFGLCSSAMAQPPDSAAAKLSPEVRQELEAAVAPLREQVQALRQQPQMDSRDFRALWADVAVFEKAVNWALKHDEFPKADYEQQTRRAIAAGLQRAAALAADTPDWPLRAGTSIRGYISRIDGSVQPYALTLPPGVNPREGRRWPLHLVLHGRANDMNEVNFIQRFESRRSDPPQTWIQLDVYGRGNNAYRWAGETDVFEALDDVRRRFRIDDNRITLHGFSMGGAGAWHLGLHYPDRWSSVGPGAGFVDFYRYQNQTKQLPPWQHATLGIYDAVDYALNAANVPVCTYGGELDPQLAASTTMAAAAAERDVPIEVIVGPGMGHKFDPASLEKFMAFHQEKSAAGRPSPQARRRIRFTTRTLRYNQCDWLTIDEVQSVYQPSEVDAEINEAGDVEIVTDNVAALSISRDAGEAVILDGDRLPCRAAAGGLLPDVTYRLTSDGWEVLDYDASREFADNPERRKRHGLQGPIDDAFMDAFVCVRGTGEPLHATGHTWALSVLEQFRREFELWFRGEVRVVDDTAVDERLIADHNLILFGDPGSNAVLRRVLPDLPIQWTADAITIGGQSWSADTHGIRLIYPNPLNPRRYIVINSGHTMHDADFRASNAWLFPRAGDVAIQRIPADNAAGKPAEQANPDGIVWAANFNAAWLLDPQP